MSTPHPPENPHPDWFGHDKVALFGAGGMPAAPPAPPGSPARRQGDLALADALGKMGTRGPRPGERPATPPPKPGLRRSLRRPAEQAMFAASMRSLAGREGAPPPAAHEPAIWRYVLGPGYRVLPWGLKRRVVKASSGVRRWHRR